MAEKKPTKFSDLTVAELRRSAVEDFAVEVSESDNKDSVIAALAESKIEWADYVAQHPEVAPEVVKSDAPKTEPVVTEPVNVVVAENIKPTSKDAYLIKMVRDNPLYEAYGYRFTSAHPYALVSAAVADKLLTVEDGFRQATPSELSEYYG